MNNLHLTKIAVAVAAVLAGTAMCFDASAETRIRPPKKIEPVAIPPRPKAFRVPQHAPAPIPKPEPKVMASNAGFATSSAFTAGSAAATPASQTLSGPVTLSYVGTANAFSLTQSGTGPGILGTISNKTSYYPAILGQSTAGSIYGMGVEGEGNYVGVYGLVPSSSSATGVTGVYGESDATTPSALDNYAVLGYGVSGNGIGVAAEASTGYGVYATSSSNYAVYGLSSKGSAIYAETDSTDDSQVAIYATNNNGSAINAFTTAASGFGVYGQSSGAGGAGVYGYDSSSGDGVIGVSDSDVGVRGYSTSGYGIYGAAGSSGTAGFFDGNVSVTGTLTVKNTVYSSDKNLKTDFRQIDESDLLARVSQLSISSWNYKSDPKTRHVGPMAQDFHSAFGLNGSDDTHVSEVDIAGVSFAAIQELNNQMKAKDAQIAELKAQVAAQSKEMTAFLARVTALELDRTVRPRTVALR